MTDTTGPHFILSGDRYGPSPYYQGTGGAYWSSSAWTSATHAYDLGLNGTDSTVYPADRNSKRYGFSLRCLAQNQTKKRNHPDSIKKTEQRRFLNPCYLPTGDPSGEYQTLYNNYNSYTAMTDTAGPHFILSGDRDGTSTNLQGTHGYYWSSLAYTSATSAYSLLLNGNASSLNPASNNSKRNGFPLRCLAQNQIKNRPRLNKKTKQNNTTKQEGIPKSPTPPNRWPFWRIPNSLQ